MDKIKVTEHIIRFNGKNIFGKLYEPRDEGSYSAVILSHGFNGSHNDFDMECKELAKNGFVAYAYDFCGGSVNSKSSLKTTEMTIFTEKEDLLAVFENIRKMKQVDENHIFLFGGSQGGFVSALAAAELGAQAAALCLYYPAFNIPDDWRNNFKEVSDIPEFHELWDMNLGKNYFLSIRDFQTFDHILFYSHKIPLQYYLA